jgi:serine/threonine protein kinase
VFLATDAALSRRVVVKVIAPELAAGVNVERFKREIHARRTAQHPHIVPVLSAGQVRTSGGDVLPYYVMPFVAGESLRARLAHRGPLSPSEAVSVLRDIAKALGTRTRMASCTADIKPDNVLVAGSAAAVLDFGIAKALAAAGARSERADHDAAAPSTQALTQLGASIGTPAYMAPEQAAGDPAIDHRADLYAFGCTAYELLTGQPRSPIGRWRRSSLPSDRSTDALLRRAERMCHRRSLRLSNDASPRIRTLALPTRRTSSARSILPPWRHWHRPPLRPGSATPTRADRAGRHCRSPVREPQPDANDEYFATALPTSSLPICRRFVHCA